MKKRALAIALALCIAATNAAGAFAAEAEGQTPPIVEEEIGLEETAETEWDGTEAEPADNAEETIEETENKQDETEVEISEADPEQENEQEDDQEDEHGLLDSAEESQNADVEVITEEPEETEVDPVSTDPEEEPAEGQEHSAAAVGEGTENADPAEENSNKADCQLSATEFIHSGKEIKPAVEVTYQDAVLEEGVQYQLTYDNNVNVGIGTVTVEATDNSFEPVTLQFKILPAASQKVTIYNVAQGLKVTWLKVEGATRYNVYRDGELIKTTSVLEITDGDVKYRSGEKFTYKVVATAKDVGESTVARTGTYYRLMPVGIKSVTNSGVGKMTLTYDKSPGSSGYVARFGLKSDMSDAKVITIKGEDTTTKIFSSLQMGKTYYVQVRTYKIEDGIRYYSGYCTTKTVKIKKMIPAYRVEIDYWLDTMDVPIGFTKKLKVDVSPYNTTDTLKFGTSNPKVATVSGTGVVKAVGKGKATISVRTTSGKRDTITVNVVDNVRTWSVSYNLNYYDYGEPTVAPMKMYYSGSKLIFETLVVNNRMFTADKFDYITITLFDSNEKQIAKKKFTNIWLGMGPYSTKKVTFTFDSATKADIIAGDYDYDYWYTYSY